MSNNSRKFVANLDNDLLLDNILAKKRRRKGQGCKVIKKANCPFKLPKTKQCVEKEIKNDVENDIIYENIIRKKHSKYLVIESQNIVDVKLRKSILGNYLKCNYLNILFGVLCFLCLFLAFGIIDTLEYFNETESFNYVVSTNFHLDKEYLKCINSPLNKTLLSNDMNLFVENLNEYIKSNYKASVMYYDLSNGFSYTYNDKEVYYAASTAKLLVALYIYSNASNGIIDLDDTVTYTKKYEDKYSSMSNEYKYGDKVTLRELVRRSILVSDNSAHHMLVSYVGKKKIIEYGKSLGAKYTLSGDDFGKIDINDAYCYLSALNEYLNGSSDLSKELKDLFLYADQDDLSLGDFDIQAVHKYGGYGIYYHNIGIIYDEKPYLVAIFTREGNNANGMKAIKDINEEIYQLHVKYNREKENYCLKVAEKKNSLS